MLPNGKICFSIFLPFKEGSGSGVLTDSNAMTCKKERELFGEGAKVFKSSDLGSSLPDSITHSLCGPGQLTYPLSAQFLPSVKCMKLYYIEAKIPWLYGETLFRCQRESKSTAIKLKYTMVCKNFLSFRDVKM